MATANARVKTRQRPFKKQKEGEKMSDKICAICSKQAGKPVRINTGLICKNPKYKGEIICYSHCSGIKTGKACKYFKLLPNSYKCGYEEEI